MRQWEGMTLNTAATDPGAFFAVNTRLYFEGEMLRRLATTRVDTKNTRNGLTGYGPPKGEQFAAIVTATGELEVFQV